MAESETLMNTVQNTHEWSLVCVIVSHFHWHKKQIVCLCLEVFQFFCLTKSCHLTLLLTSSLPPPPGCLDRLFICPAWARKGYCESKRRLMQKHCPSSCDFCYGKKQKWQWQQESRGKEKKKKTEKVFSQLSSTRSCCEPFANGATGANRSSHAELRWRFSRVWFVGRLHLALGESVFYFWRVAAFQNVHTAGPLPVDCSLSEGCFTQVLLIRQLPL